MMRKSFSTSWKSKCRTVRQLNAQRKDISAARIITLCIHGEFMRIPFIYRQLEVA